MIISVEKTLYNSAERKGMEKGMEKGKAEEQLLIASNMKKQGISAAIISQCTGLPIKDIDLI